MLTLEVLVSQFLNVQMLDCFSDSFTLKNNICCFVFTIQRTEDPSVAVDAGLGLMQLKIDPASKEVTTKRFRKEKMASSRAKKNKKHRVIR